MKSRDERMEMTAEYDYADVLLKASELVAEDGRWVQGMWFKGAGRHIDRATAARWDQAGEKVGVCALGAVTLAGERLGVEDSVLRRARARVSGFLRRMTGSGSVMDYNDTQGRTADEVADLLRAVAES